MASIHDLRELYESFCSFGSNRNLATGQADMADDPTMDGTKFIKFAKDCKIVDGKKVTTTDVDILFKRAIPKGGRRLDWNGFQDCFQWLADKKYPGKNSKDAYDNLLTMVCDKGPIARGTITETGGVYDKLLNTNLYTGTHKNRFDSEGVGKGAAGRDQPKETDRLDQLINRDTSSYTGNTNNPFGSTKNISGPNPTTGLAKKRGQAAVVTASVESLEVKSQPKKKQDSHSSNGALNQGSNKNLNKSSTSMNKPTTANNKSTSNFSTAKTGGSGNVYDRLTDTSGYTGTHKERFNADGSGKGLSGREPIAKGTGTNSSYKGGNVNSIAQILRT